MQVSAPLRSAGGPSVRVPKVLTQCAHSVTRCCTAETKWSSSHDCFAALISPARLPATCRPSPAMKVRVPQTSCPR